VPAVVPSAATSHGSDEATVRRSKRSTPYLLLAPGLGWLAVFFVVPLFASLATSLQVPLVEGDPDQGYTQGFAVENYVNAITEYWPQFLKSFLYAGIATLIALAIAYPLAYFIAFHAGKWRNIMLILVVAPFFCSFLIRTYAWKTILADQSPVTQFLNALNLLPDDRILNTPLAVITGIAYNFLPFMTLPLYAALERIDFRLIEAGGDLYGSAWTTFRKVTFPLSLPGVVAGTLLTFIPAVGDFINAQLLGSVKDKMIGNVIDSQFRIVRDYPTASALSFLLMAATLTIVFLYIRRAGTDDLV
jgi:spermidine/putrescine transport system permease protein